MRRLLVCLAIFALLYWYLGGEWPNLDPRHWTSDRTNCDPSYPTVCIPSPPPRVDCDDLPFANFKVFGADPQNLDPDHDGIGCQRL